jgi:hypothetical protein
MYKFIRTTVDNQLLSPYICLPLYQGRVAEWLGRGLQNLVQRFESALDLFKSILKKDAFFMSSSPFYQNRKPFSGMAQILWAGSTIDGLLLA